MRNLYEKNSIETWMLLAEKVRRLDFSNQTEKEFYDNFKKITKLLSDTQLSLTMGYRCVSKKNEIGLLTLLYSIYQIESVDSASKGIIFYKKILDLLKLGIKSIEFLPAEFYAQIRMEETIEKGKTQLLSKAFTDGEFDFCRIGKKAENLKILNLTNANYILKFDMRRDENDKLIIIDGCASLKNFNGNFPTLKEVRKDTYPEIDEAPPRYFFDKEPHLSKQIFDVTNSNCVKKM